jgi:hypothetical protein
VRGAGIARRAMALSFRCAPLHAGTLRGAQGDDRGGPGKLSGREGVRGWVYGGPSAPCHPDRSGTRRPVAWKQNRSGGISSHECRPPRHSSLLIAPSWRTFLLPLRSSEYGTHHCAAHNQGVNAPNASASPGKCSRSTQTKPPSFQPNAGNAPNAPRFAPPIQPRCCHAILV